MKTQSQLQDKTISAFELTQEFIQSQYGPSQMSDQENKDNCRGITKASEFPGQKTTIQQSVRQQQKQRNRDRMSKTLNFGSLRLPKQDSTLIDEMRNNRPAINTAMDRGLEQFIGK